MLALASRFYQFHQEQLGLMAALVSADAHTSRLQLQTQLQISCGGLNYHEESREQLMWPQHQRSVSGVDEHLPYFQLLYATLLCPRRCCVCFSHRAVQIQRVFI